MATHKEFGAQTTATQVLDAFGDSVRGKTILITGVGPNGLGATLARELARKSPALLVLTGRALQKVEAVAKEISAESPSVKTRILRLDVASFQSIEAAAKVVNAYSEPGIDVLFNNAGVMNIPERTLSVNGFEMHFVTNFLGAFLFTNSIMEKLIQAKGRVVNISSSGHLLSPVRFSDYNFDGKDIPESEQPSKANCEMFGVPWGLDYLPPIAYGQSKSAIILYTVSLAKKLASKGVSAVSLNPGAIATDLWRQMPREVVDQIMKAMPTKTQEQGASTPLVAALDPKLAGPNAQYLDDCQVTPTAEWAASSENAEKLWTLSEKLTGKKFSW